MDRKEAISKINETLAAYFPQNNVRSCEPYGNGHINDTFLVVTDKQRYILQRINHVVFPHPEQVMENILLVTNHIRKAAKVEGKDYSRSTLTVIRTSDGKDWFTDSIGCYWRLYDFVENTVSKEKVEGGEDFKNCGRAFGAFQGILADFDADKLHEAIVDFHNTPVRFKKLLKAIEEDKLGRAKEVEKEISFALEREEFAKILEAEHEAGLLPKRVTHNDTKLNNILFDSDGITPVCVIDLDTVMSGYSVTDFGDSIRFGANTSAEGETDIEKISMDLSLFESYAEGFIEGCEGRLTKRELELLAEGAMMMTFECGIRFLTDYLEGDVYFKIHRPKHNLERCINQFALLADMERKIPEMKRIISKLSK